VTAGTQSRGKLARGALNHVVAKYITPVRQYGANSYEYIPVDLCRCAPRSSAVTG
jgi:hypothetical protein